VEKEPRKHREPLFGLTETSIILKVGMVGDAQIGKTSLMVKYVEGSFE
jgi:GTP-binding protein of the ras superfamily involved in termination of M-phase